MLNRLLAMLTFILLLHSCYFTLLSAPLVCSLVSLPTYLLRALRKSNGKQPAQLHRLVTKYDRIPRHLPTKP
jgi:hypothetical protein